MKNKPYDACDELMVRSEGIWEPKNGNTHIIDPIEIVRDNQRGHKKITYRMFKKCSKFCKLLVISMLCSPTRNTT